MDHNPGHHSSDVPLSAGVAALAAQTQSIPGLVIRKNACGGCDD